MQRFNVFGRLVGIERNVEGWVAYFLGSEGKRRPAEFIVPDFIPEEELAQYLNDLFHESASSANPDVTRLI